MITSKWSVWKQVTPAALAVNPSYFTVTLTPCPICCACFVTGKLLGAAASQTARTRGPAPTQAAVPTKPARPPLSLSAAHSHGRSYCRSHWAKSPAPEVHNPKSSTSLERQWRQDTTEHWQSWDSATRERIPGISVSAFQLLSIPRNTVFSPLLQISSGH